MHAASSIRPALVVFDLAGTTVRDRGEVPAAFADALAAAGLAVDVARIARWRGASKREAAEQLVREAMPSRTAAERAHLAEAVYRDFCRTLMARLAATPDLAIPEAQRAFERLHDLGMQVALNSGFDRAIVEAIVQATGWPPALFEAIVGGDDVTAGRPEPDMIFACMECTGVTDAGRVAVVGDTRLDLEAAAHAGAAWRIGVLTGAHDRATLERAPHTHLVASVGNVPDLWA